MFACSMMSDVRALTIFFFFFFKMLELLVYDFLFDSLKSLNFTTHTHRYKKKEKRRNVKELVNMILPQQILPRLYYLICLSQIQGPREDLPKHQNILPNELPPKASPVDFWKFLQSLF